MHSLFASTDEWDNQLEAANEGWSGFLAILRIYLRHFRGQRSALMQLTAPSAGTDAEKWEALTSALGMKGISVGQRWTTPVRRRCGRRGFSNTSRCRQSRAGANELASACTLYADHHEAARVCQPRSHGQVLASLP